MATNNGAGKPVHQIVQSTSGTDRLTRLANLAGTGALKITLDKTFSAAEIIQALEYQKAGKSRGKNIVLIQP